MLRLMRIRLVNWHFFGDTIVPIGATTLFAGDNGTGKSTIIDAIQYALVAQIQRIRFNSAASDRRASRTLESYCLCKIGADSLGYVRQACTTHVILEFSDGSKNFCTGMIVEASTDGCKEYPWILEDGKLEDIRVYDGDRFLSTRDFRDLIKEAGAALCATKKEYNSRLTMLLRVHRRNSDFNPYLETVVRSVNFTPFSSVHDFVCNYILEERSVDISAMKENLENYKLAEREAILMEEKITRLREIHGKTGDIEKLNRQIVMQEYFKRRLDLEFSSQKLEKAERTAVELERETAILEELIESKSEQRERLDGIRQEVTFALARDDLHQLYERLSTAKTELSGKIQSEEERIRRLELLKTQCEALIGRKLAESIDDELRLIENERKDLSDSGARLSVRIDELKRGLSDLTTERRELESGILRYPESTMVLKAAIEKAGIPAQIFADLLEVTDENWQNAIEGWLNTQRFNILVPEDEFQRAVEIYDKLPNKTAGVGLPNLSRMRDAEALPGTLAELVEAASPGARRYTAFLLGDVVRTDITSLKRYEKSVTKQCMRYSSHTASRIKEDVYSRWYIGKEAKRRRLAAVTKEIDRLTGELEAALLELKKAAERTEILRRAYRSLYDVGGLHEAREKLNAFMKEYEEIVTRIASIDTSGFTELKLQIASLSESLKTIELEIRETVGKHGGKKEKLNVLQREIEHLRAESERRSLILDGFLSENREFEPEFEAYYGERMKAERKTGGVNYENLLSRYEPALAGLRTRLDRIRSELTGLKRTYNADFHVYLTTEGDDSLPFIELLRTYENTELPEYREKIARARGNAENQFREHFVSRLNEYINDARESFKEINYILAERPFGQDLYRFMLQDLAEKKGFLEVIRKASEISDFEGTLFEALTTSEEQESVERVFETILRNDSDAESVRQICDYRQYFQYDIRIRHTQTLDPETARPLESSLSRVLREKSGGETQTPYYVAIAASFLRFFKDDPAAVRLALFDEAFNKMDDERIGTMIRFFKDLGMQVITAVPTEKIESIAPFMDRTNLVLRRDYRAYIRDYEILPEHAR